MEHEEFAHHLYADWNGFCRICFERVMDECLSGYDKDKVLHELEQVELDLGSIPEDDFYQEFPRRLKEALLKALPSWDIQDREEKTGISRIDNLLFYLEQGYPKTEWADEGFNLTEELDWMTMQVSAYTRRLLQVCLNKEQAFRRLLWQVHDEAVLLRLYAILLSEPAFTLNEKRYSLTLLLEVRPDIPVHFVHVAKGDVELRKMAELLDTMSVRRIMEIEAGEHAEVDLPPYWHYLYEWLVQHYPFNGLSIFGGKSDFVRHLHHRLLTFINKRSYSFHLSKVELTIGFLLEVFGPSYYIDVLNAIYDLQPHLPDGSPAYDSYFNRELYRIFLQLSLLRLPKPEEEVFNLGNAENHYPVDAKALTAFLKDTRHNEADKRALVILLAKERPELLVEWLKILLTDKENASVVDLLSFVAGFLDKAMVSRLLASISFTVMETALQIIGYLRNHTVEINCMNGISRSRIEYVFNKSVLYWIANEHFALSEADSIRRLLHTIFREITGHDSATDVEMVLTKLRLQEKHREDWMFTELHLQEKSQKDWGLSAKETSSTVMQLRKFRAVLADNNISEAIKRRMLVWFLEQYRGKYADAILLLHRDNLLAYAIHFISLPVLEEIIRQMVNNMDESHDSIGLLPLIHWMITHETVVFPFLQDQNQDLKVQLLVWLAEVVQSEIGTDAVRLQTVASIPFPQTVEGRMALQQFYYLLTLLFGKENIQLVIARIFQALALGTGREDIEENDVEMVLDLLLSLSDNGYSSSYKGNSYKRLFEEWQHQSEETLNIIQTLLESRWNTDKGFVEWLEDMTVPADRKRDWLQMMVIEKPQKWIHLLRKQNKEDKVVFLLSDSLSFSLLLQSMARTDFYQASVLSHIVDWLQRTANGFDFLRRSSVALSTALSQALLLYIKDTDTLGGRVLTELEVVQIFMSYLHLVYTGKYDYQEDTVWMELSDRMVMELGMDDTKFSRHIASIMEKRPERLLVWIEKEADTSSIMRIASTSDALLLSQWTSFLPLVAGFEYPDVFKRLMGWLIRLAISRSLVSDIMSVLFLWIKETAWRKQTPEQMEEYFLTHLFGKALIRLPVENILDSSVPENIRMSLLHRYIHFQPKELLDYIRQSVHRNVLSLRQWAEWLSLKDWMRLAASLSLSQAELLQQMADYLIGTGQTGIRDLQIALATCITEKRAEEWIYKSKEEMVRLFVESFPDQKQATERYKDMEQQLKEELKIIEVEESALVEEQAETPEYLLIGNAGLCLLAPWLPRLFSLLGYLDEAGRELKNTVSKVRAIFLLQYLTCSEEREYQEMELAFNRLLVALPMYIPLPRYLELTDEEKRAADSMLEGVKANWSKMDGTSIKGFQQSFIIRRGRLEQQEEKWVLTVESKGYDILLDSVPWSFKQIHFSWLKKYMQVIWHEEQNF